MIAVFGACQGIIHPASGTEGSAVTLLALAAFTAGLVVPVGKLVALHVENDDAMVHTFTYHVDGQEHTTIIPAKSEMGIHFKFDAPTTIHYWCAPHGGGEKDDGSGMVGTLLAQ